MKKALNLFDITFTKVFTRGNLKGLQIIDSLPRVSNPEKFINGIRANNQKGKLDYFITGVRVTKFH